MTHAVIRQKSLCFLNLKFILFWSADILAIASESNWTLRGVVFNVEISCWLRNSAYLLNVNSQLATETLALTNYRLCGQTVKNFKTTSRNRYGRTRFKFKVNLNPLAWLAINTFFDPHSDFFFRVESVKFEVRKRDRRQTQTKLSLVTQSITMLAVKLDHYRWLENTIHISLSQYWIFVDKLPTAIATWFSRLAQKFDHDRAINFKRALTSGRKCCR